MACKPPVQPLAIATQATGRPLPIVTTLPPELLEAVKTTFTQWQIVEKTDYSNTWYSFYDSSYNACWARTDINDDQQADYAVLLKKQNELQLVICMGRRDHAYTPYSVYKTTIHSTNQQPVLTTGVTVAPPGQTDVVTPRIQSLLLKSNGFALLELEALAKIFYWQQDSIKTFSCTNTVLSDTF